LLVEKICRAEDEIKRWAAEQGIFLTILRLTLIYGGLENKNIY
jgi:hypothetical protein